MRLAIEFDWTELGEVMLSTAGRLRMPEVPAMPGIYRFRIAPPTGVEVYIGESDNLRRRMLRNYASTHNGPTNVRIRNLLLSHLTAEGPVHLAIVSRAVLRLDGEPISANLTLQETRLLIENAALTTARHAGEQIHNLSRHVSPGLTKSEPSNSSERPATDHSEAGRVASRRCFGARGR